MKSQPRSQPILVLVLLAISCGADAAGVTPVGTPGDPLRGDADGDGGRRISDAILLLRHLFLGGPAARCAPVADVDASGELDLSDPIFLLAYLFQSGPEPGPLSQEENDVCRVPIDPARLLGGAWDDRLILPGANGDSPGARAIGSGPNGDIYMGGIFSHVGRRAARNIAAWSANDGWRPLGDGLDGIVTAIAVAPGGAVYASAARWDEDFTSYWHDISSWDGERWTGVARVELPAGLDRPESAGVQELAFTASGELIAAGSFTAIGGAAIPNLARLADPERAPGAWSSIGEPPDGPVLALLVEPEGICASGAFTRIGGRAASRVACWDGVDWTALDLIDTDTPGGEVHVLARSPAGEIHAGGSFYLSDPASNDGGGIARWDGEGWRLVDRGLGIWSIFEQRNRSGLVRGIAWRGGELIAGGTFLNAGGATVLGDAVVPVRHLARAAAAGWSNPGEALLEVGFAFDFENVLGTIEAGGDIYAAGIFSSAGGSPAFNVARWNGAAWSPLESDADGPSSGVGGGVVSLASSGTGAVYVGGAFATAGTTRASNVAAFVPGRGFEPLGEGLEHGVDALVLEGDGGPVLAAENWCDPNPDLGCFARVSRWDGASWSVVAPPRPAFIRSIALGSSGELYAAGNIPPDAERGHVVVDDGDDWRPLGGGTGSIATALLVDGAGALIAGGYFEEAGGIAARHIARFDGERWSALGDGLDGPVLALAKYRGRIVAGSQIDPRSPATFLVAEWDGAGWRGFGSQLGVEGGNPQIGGLVGAGGHLIATGQFPYLGGVAIFDGEDWTLLGSGMNQLGRAIVLHEEGLFIGGGFSMVDGLPSVGLGWLRPRD